jgi:nucleotide-binding universal stress UspA family protein
MFNRIVVPLDGTAESNTALPVARTFARATAGAISLVRVRTGGETSEDIRAQLTRVADELTSATLQVRTVVRDGDPADEILAEVRAQDADLIVMRTHGRSGLGRMVLGSVAQRLLTEAQVPVVLVRPGGRRLDRVRSVLVPVDGSPGGAIALGAALGLAQSTGAALRLLQVTVPIASYVYAGAAWHSGAYIDAAWDEEALAAATTYVNGLCARLTARLPAISGEAVIATSVADAIVDRAREQGCDLIVMSSHALTGVARAILGSVADAVVRKADCPVLVIHTAARTPGAADDAAALGSQTANESRSLKPG